MKKEFLFPGIAFVLLTIPLTFFLNLFFLRRNFPLALPFWNINLFLYFELAIILLGSVWVLYSIIISKLFTLDVKEVLKKDLFTYLPLFLLLLYFTDTASYTKNWISPPTLLAAILFLITVFKVAVLLHFKNKRNASYLLALAGIMLPLILTNYFVLKTHYLGTHQNFQSPKNTEVSLVGNLENQYSADPLSLFGGELEGVYKKKIRINNEIRNALVLLPPKRVETTVKIPPESFLQFGFGVLEDSFTGEGDGIQFNLFFKSKDEVKLVYAKYIDPKHYIKDRKWFDVNLDLKEYANREVNIIFEVLGSPEVQPPFERKTDNRDDYAVISDPRLIRLAPARNTSDYNVIFISIDTLRADHLGCYGYKRKDISPNIDLLASKGILFENAISQAPWTIPSHMSMFTSLLPSYHRVNESIITFEWFLKGARGADYRVLSEDITTLPEIFRANGYKTIAVTSGGTVAGILGFCKGFDVFKETPLLECLDQLENWLRTNQNRKFFMFLHTMRVHAPYIDLTYADEVMTDAEIDELEGLISGMLKSLSKAIFLTMRNAKGVIAAQREKLKEMGLYTKEVTEALYDGGINKTDGYIGELIEVLKRTGVLNNTIIVLTSDHGEEFGDHNPRYFYDFHGRSLYEEMVRVPLIFVVPGNFPQGKRINFQVRLIDIMPTLLGLNRIEYDASRVQGVSLVPIIQGKGMENELVAISEALGLGPESKSIRTNKAKYIYTVKSGNLTNGERTLVAHNPDKEELYDLLLDPGEKNNIKQLEPHLSAVSKNKINKILENAVKAPSGAKKEKRIKVDEQMKNRLKALGYIE